MLSAFASAFSVAETSISAIHLALEAGTVTCTEIASLSLARIQKFDPILNVMVQVDSEAVMRRAAILQKGSQGGKLYCIPIILKDNLAKADEATSAGVKGLSQSNATSDCPVIAALLAAGALILGRANMPDFALDGMNTNSSRKGQTLNPYDFLVTPYGSSGGPAVAAAVSFAVVVIGTDTNGSIQNPSAAANLFGLRPTQYLVSTQGVLPLLTFQDTVGPLARSVTDLATTLEVIVNSSFASHGSQNYTSFLNPKGLQGVRLGFLRFMAEDVDLPLRLRVDPAIQALCNETLKNWTEAGADVVEITSQDLLWQLVAIIQNSSFYETDCVHEDFKFAVGAFLSQAKPFPGVPTSIGEVLSAGQLSLPAAVFVRASNTSIGTIPASQYPSCISDQIARNQAAALLMNAMDKYNLTALVYPTSNQAPPALAQLSSPPDGFFTSNIVSAISGLPALVLPMGFVVPMNATASPADYSFDTRLSAWRPTPENSKQRGFSSFSAGTQGSSPLPVGMTLLGRSFQEALLISVAFASEQKFPQRHAPSETP